MEDKKTPDKKKKKKEDRPKKLILVKIKPNFVG